eukprot:gb/GECG01011423.1/.p1 GENE.gb/GECG01011423.1/~~gb/GECG01011423.1/.p1  ORF type:complete len:186 (+),score=23.40 gb/GECG01011423.1/:1-558(+)
MIHCMYSSVFVSFLVTLGAKANVCECRTGKHKGYCFLEYDTPEAAETAISVMNGFELAGRKIRVGRPHIAPGSAVSQVPGFDMNNVANAAAAQASLPTQDATATAPTTAQSEQAENSQTETTTATDEAPASSGNDSETEVSQTVKAPATASENKKSSRSSIKSGENSCVICGRWRCFRIWYAAKS